MILFRKQQTAVVTGGDSGIGKATAQLLAKEGVNIILSDKTHKELETTANEIRPSLKEGQTLQTVTADLRKPEDVRKLAAVAKDAAIVVHCAGARGAAGDFLTLSDEDWQETINVDLMGAVRVCRAFLPQLIENGWGRIVLVASENALQPYEEESPYNACKAGVINLTKCLSRAYARHGVRINCVSPAFIATPMTDAMMEEKARKEQISKDEAIQIFLKEQRPNIVTDRRGKPEEVAAVIAFLCSEQANYVTGSNYRVDGGSVSTAFG